MPGGSINGGLVAEQMETSAAALRVRAASWLTDDNPVEAQLLADLATRLEGWADQRRQQDDRAASV